MFTWEALSVLLFKKTRPSSGARSIEPFVLTPPLTRGAAANSPCFDRKPNRKKGLRK
jgi:hypothetical protein